MKAKKSLGQNFLIDNQVISKIIDEVTASKDDLVIEIGPGKGALTKLIKDKDCYVLAYELDTDLSYILSKLESDKVQVIYNDFLKSNIKSDISNINYNNLYIVGNLPYYITTPIIEHIIDSNINFKKLTIMVQKEVANRFMALEKTKDYGYITVVLRYYFDIYKVIDAPSKCFNPAPKVDSTVISLIPKTRKSEVDTVKYFEFLKVAFRLKRKNLRNNLKGYYDLSIVEKVLYKYDLDLSVRAEELSCEILLEIFNTLENSIG